MAETSFVGATLAIACGLAIRVDLGKARLYPIGSQTPKHHLPFRELKAIQKQWQ